MEDAHTADFLNEWEQIQLETDPQDCISNFPPSSREALQIPIPPPPTPPSDSQIAREPSSGAECNAEGEESLQSDSDPKVGNEIGKHLRLRLEIFRSGFVWIARRARSGCRLWSFASVSLAVAAAVLLYSRVQRWRQWIREESENRLILVIKEKDQKINQLALQIAQMNETLAGRRKVAVVRSG